jgi:hypothetical protein
LGTTAGLRGCGLPQLRLLAGKALLYENNSHLQRPSNSQSKWDE